MASTPITRLNAIDPTVGIEPNSVEIVPNSGGQVDVNSLPLLGDRWLQNTNLLNQTTIQNLNSFWSQLQAFIAANPALTVGIGIFLIVLATNHDKGRGR